MTRGSISLGVLATISAVLVLAGAVADSPAASANPGCQSVVVPAYFYPGGDWTRADVSWPLPRIMILDISGVGAGTAPNREYQAAVARAQAAGIEIMGYAATGYGRRPAAAVEADVRNYRAWYHVTDIFLDQSASGAGELAYYRALAGYVHRVNPGSTVMLNPGTYPDRRYMSVGDIVMVYENTFAHLGRLRVPGWADDYPAARFAFAIYATPGSRLAGAIALSRERGAGYVYVTDGTLPDPYSSLPDYWRAENSLIAAQCGG
jgi:hypothetical protein